MDPAAPIRIGTAGWSYKDWDGVLYPPEVTRKRVHPVEFLARFFDVIEINTSFYGHIRAELGRLWCRKAKAVNPNFVFTAKLHRSFTHSPLAVMEPTSAASIRQNDDDERLAREGLESLATEGMLGALLIQFPVSFKNTSLNREYLEQLLRQFIEYPRVVEVRHESWDNPETIAQFMRHNVGFCNIDQPLLGKSLGPTEHVTSGIGARIRPFTLTTSRPASGMCGFTGEITNIGSTTGSTLATATTVTTISTNRLSWKSGKRRSRSSRRRRSPLL